MDREVNLPVSRSRPPCRDVQRYSCACRGMPSSVRVGFDRGCTLQRCLLPEKLTYCSSPENIKYKISYKHFLNSIFFFGIFPGILVKEHIQLNEAQQTQVLQNRYVFM